MEQQERIKSIKQKIIIHKTLSDGSLEVEANDFIDLLNLGADINLLNNPLSVGGYDHELKYQDVIIYARTEREIRNI